MAAEQHRWSETAAMIALWYATSIVATNTSKSLEMDAAVSYTHLTLPTKRIV